MRWELKASSGAAKLKTFVPTCSLLVKKTRLAAVEGEWEGHFPLHFVLLGQPVQILETNKILNGFHAKLKVLALTHT